MPLNLTLYEFKLLPDYEQYYLVFTKAQFLTYLAEEKKRFALYALNKFFLEIEYDVESNKIVNKVSFISGDKLNLYSDFLDVN